MQTSSSPTESSVAFARVKDLEEYVTSHITLQASMNNLWEHEHFNDEYWIKIGVSTHIKTLHSMLQFLKYLSTG